MANDLQFTIGADTAPFYKGMQSATKAADEAAKRIQAVMLKAASVLAIAFGAKKLTDMVVGAVQMGKELDSLSRQSGIAAEHIGLMTHALDRSGQTAESTTGILEGMRGKLREAERGMTDATVDLTKLELTFADLKDLSLPEQFALIASKINSIQDPVRRAAVATSILGESGAKAAANFSAEDIQRAAKNFGVSAEAMAKSAPALARASDAIHRVQEGASAFIQIVVAKMAPVIEKVAETLESVLPMMEKTAEKFGKSLFYGAQVLMQAFKEGKLGDLLLKAVTAAGLTAMDYVIKVVHAFTAGLGEALGQVTALLADTSLWSGIREVVNSIVEGALGLLMEGLAEPLKMFQDGFQFIAQYFDQQMSKIANGIIVGLGKHVFGEDKVKRAEANIATIGRNPVTLEGVRKENEGKQAELFGLKAKDFTGNAAEGMAKAAEHFKNINVKDLIRPGEIAGAMTRAFRGDTSFGKDAKKAQDDLVKTVAALGANVKPLTFDESKKPGEGGKLSGKAGFLETGFDSLRRVGGGLASGATTVAQKSLDKLTSINDEMKKVHAVLSSTKSHNEFSGGASRSGMVAISG